MTTRLNYQQPAILGSTVTDLAQLTGREGAAFFDRGQSLIELGHRCYNGESSQGEFKINLVELANWLEDFPSAHCLVSLVEDGYTPDIWLSRGRIATDEGGRGLVKAAGELEWSITVDDCNNELRGQAFTEPWVRPAETDVARLVALQAYTLAGNTSTAPFFRSTCAVTVNTSHLTPNTNTISMPAKKYPAGTQPEEVVRDCADTAGKQYGVVIHHTGGSHLCLFYTVNNDHTTYLSAAKISDQLADWVPTSSTVPVFEPHWEQGVGQIIAMQTVLSGMVGVWGASETAAYVDYPGIEENTDYWVETYHDGFSTTQTQALNRTAGILEGRRNSHVTHRVSVIMNPNQVHLIAAGMSIDIKTAVTFNRGAPAGDPNAYERRRIAECRFEPRIDGRYWCHLDLERPPLRVAPGRGQVGPIPPQQSEPPVGETVDWSWSYDVDKTDDQTSTLSSGGNYDTWGNPGGSVWIGVSTSSGYLGYLDTFGEAGVSPGVYHFKGDFWNNSSSGNPDGIKVEVVGHNAAHGVTVTHTSPFIATALHEWDHYEADITFPAGTTHFGWGTFPYKGHAVDNIVLSHGGTEPAFVGTTPPPAATGGTGSIGTSPIYSPSDHTHAAQTAEVTPITDDGQYFEGFFVEEALQEIGETLGIGGEAPTELVGALLIGDDHSTPLVFDDLLQTEEGDDLLYVDI